MKNENGFSLIELVAALAISSTLAVVGLTTLTPLIGQFEDRAAAIEQQEADRAAELEWYLDSIAN
jgi:prepilin-type N-terminal cleavage/methylation domain-containing protein